LKAINGAHYTKFAKIANEEDEEAARAAAAKKKNDDRAAELAKILAGIAPAPEPT
jgi:hypothetical protein